MAVDRLQQQNERRRLLVAQAAWRRMLRRHRVSRECQAAREVAREGRDEHGWLLSSCGSKTRSHAPA